MRLPLEFTAFALLALCLSAPKLFAQEPVASIQNAPKIVEQIQGDFRLESGTIDGSKMTSNRVTDVSVKITDKTITTYDGQRQQRFGASYKLLGDKRPWPVTLKSVKKVTSSDGQTKEKTETSEGILDLSEDGEHLWLAYAVDGAPRPKDFKGGKQQHVFELRPLKTTPKPENPK